jgi:hypothetical protein
MGFFGGDGDEFRDELLQHRAAIVVEGAGEVDGFASSERAEAGVEVIVVPVDKFQRNDARIRKLADKLLGMNIAANAITGNQRVATVQRIPRCSWRKCDRIARRL